MSPRWRKREQQGCLTEGPSPQTGGAWCQQDAWGGFYINLRTLYCGKEGGGIPLSVPSSLWLRADHWGIDPLASRLHMFESKIFHVGALWCAVREALGQKIKNKQEVPNVCLRQGTARFYLKKWAIHHWHGWNKRWGPKDLKGCTRGVW